MQLQVITELCQKDLSRGIPRVLLHQIHFWVTVYFWHLVSNPVSNNRGVKLHRLKREFTDFTFSVGHKTCQTFYLMYDAQHPVYSTGVPIIRLDQTKSIIWWWKKMFDILKHDILKGLYEYRWVDLGVLKNRVMRLQLRGKRVRNASARFWEIYMGTQDISKWNPDDSRLRLCNIYT